MGRGFICIGICKSRKTGLYSIRKDGYLFWTGLKTNNWVEESDEDQIFETKNRTLLSITLFFIRLLS